jgi:2-polyprenyl-6-hydroxyphenyl methylase/3-demethylubiquinone-9 3-methyltransferase
MDAQPPPSLWDHSSHERFYEYYAHASQSEKTKQRFLAIRATLLKMLQQNQTPSTVLDVADIGCGAGTQSILWAELGHHVHGLDVNERFITLARQRATAAGHCIDFHIGSAVQLPWNDWSMDVCLVPELLEHVAPWRACLHEFARILRPGGVLFLTTTNKLCPVQQEFTLPLYSWYPAPAKRYVERLARTTRPQLANYAHYPAVNWFSFYSLRSVLTGLGFQCLDRFDIADAATKGALARCILCAVHACPLVRWLAHVATPNTTVVAVKGKDAKG